MTITVTNCSTIVLNTTEVTGLTVDDLVGLQLTHKFNCGSSAVLDLTDSMDTIVTSDDDGTYFTLTAAQYYDDETVEKFCEGIYYFQVTLMYSVDSTSYDYNGSICTLLDCENYIKCKVKDYLIDTMDARPLYMLDAIELANECDTCTCTNMCSMYNDLLATINLNIDGTTSGCGCS